MTEMLQEGYFEALLDVQTFDADAVASIRDNPRHIEMDAEMYADPQAKGNVANELDVMILSATEVDINFNVNVLTASDGVIMGGAGRTPRHGGGGQPGRGGGPLIRKRVPIVVDRVVTISTPGECVDVVVTERGIARQSPESHTEGQTDRAGPAGLRDRGAAGHGLQADRETGTPSIRGQGGGPGGIPGWDHPGCHSERTVSKKAAVTVFVP